jgi:hypothetical protein
MRAPVYLTDSQRLGSTRAVSTSTAEYDRTNFPGFRAFFFFAADRSQRRKCTRGTEGQTGQSRRGVRRRQSRTVRITEPSPPAGTCGTPTEQRWSGGSVGVEEKNIIYWVTVVLNLNLKINSLRDFKPPRLEDPDSGGKRERGALSRRRARLSYCPRRPAVDTWTEL